MNMIFSNFRLWWQRPRNIRDRVDHRQVTFLELFYDLVYVALIAQLTHALATQIDLTHILNFMFLFFIVWWAWLNGTSYHDLHGNDDIRTRVFTFLQMFTVVAMAVFAHDAMGDTSVGFALSYAAFQLILTYLWWRTGVHDPNHRPLSTPYVFAFLINTLLFVASVFVEPPLRFYLWGISTVISLMLPIVLAILARNRPEVQEQITLSLTPSASFVERFGLLTIIVLGEVVVAVVSGLSSLDDMTMDIGLVAILSMLIGISLWWLFFDYVSHRKPSAGRISFLIWALTHLVVSAGIAMIGAAILNVIEQGRDALPSDVRWLLVLAIAGVLLGIAILIQTIRVPEQYHMGFRKGQIVMVIAAMIIVALGLTSLETIPLLITIVICMITPVFFGLAFWLKETVHNLENAPETA